MPYDIIPPKLNNMNILLNIPPRNPNVIATSIYGPLELDNKKYRRNYISQIGFNLNFLKLNGKKLYIRYAT